MYLFISLFVLIIHTALGSYTLYKNPQSTKHRTFFICCMAVSYYIAFMARTSLADNQETAKLLIILTCISGYLVLYCLNLFRLSLVFPDKTILQLIKRAPIFTISIVLVILLCYSPYFITGVSISTYFQSKTHVWGQVPQTTRGPGDWLFGSFVVYNLVLLFVRSFRYSRSLRGIRQLEHQYLLIGLAVSLLLSAIFERISLDLM